MAVVITLASLQERSAAFVRDREYEQYHSPKNVVMSLSTEVGELAKHFITPTATLSEDGVDELADVFNNVAELAMRLGIALPEIESIDASPLTEQSLMMQLVHKVSQVTEYFIWLSEEESKDVDRTKVTGPVTDVFTVVVQLANKLGVDMLQAASNKLDKNEAKYSLAHSKGRRVKGKNKDVCTTNL